MVTDLELWRMIAINGTCNVIVFAIFFVRVKAAFDRFDRQCDERERLIKQSERN